MNPVWVCYGGGTDSTAMLLEMIRRSERIDIITFADTGAEFPHTYEMVRYMNNWLIRKGYPGITVIKYRTRDGDGETLEESIVKNKTLPSLAFGWHTCSIRFKIAPQVKYIKQHPILIEAQERGIKMIRCIGYDAGGADSKRANRSQAKYPDLGIFENRYPLREWGWDRQRCLAEILSEGLPDPGKSSCYFCPAMKKHEIEHMRINNPEHFKRALWIEQNALDGGKLEKVAGLARRYAWKDLYV